MSGDVLDVSAGAAWFEQAFEHLPVGVALTATNGTVLRANRALAAMLGCERKALVGTEILSRGDAGTGARSNDAEAFAGALPSGIKNVVNERSLTRCDGTTMRAEISATMICDATGQPNLIQTVVDVTARYDTMQRLIVATSEKLMFEEAARCAHESLLEGLPVGVALVNVATRKVLLLNDRLREMLGARPDRIVDEHGVLRSLPLKHADGTPLQPGEEPVESARAGSLVARSDLGLARPDGVTIPIDLRTTRVPHQGTDAVVVALQDLTELRAEERRSLAAERRYRALFEQATEAILLLSDDAARIVDANPAAERLFDRESLQFARPSQGHEPPSSGIALETMTIAEHIGAARKDGVARFDLRGTRPDGSTVDVEATLQPAVVEGRPGLVLQARDVTHERALEADLRQSQKLEAIGQLVGGVAHDYNNLLTGILGFIDLAIDAAPPGQPEGDRLTRFLRQAQRAGLRSVELTRQLLTFSRRAESHTKAIDLNSVVSQATAMIRHLVGESIRLDVRLDERACPVQADSGQLEQVLLNLSINARDAMAGGGTLSISTQRTTAPGKNVGGVPLPPGENVLLTVSDTGQGISPEVREHLFQPFFTTKERGRGTGLGLAVVHGIVERHKGKIFVDSAPGKGASFTVTLPCIGESALVAGTAGGEVPRGEGQVLVVDDDPTVRAVTAAMLETLGYTVSEAGDALAAAVLLRRSRYDLLVSDVVMPGTSGIELARQIRSEHLAVEVLLVSGYARDAFERDGASMQTSEWRFLAKPFTLETLGRTVADVLAARDSR